MSKSATSTEGNARWLPVSSVKPYCPRDVNALGTPVLIWPRSPKAALKSMGGADGFAYYGRRATNYPAFYIHGAEIPGVTHWMPLPKGPK